MSRKTLLLFVLIYFEVNFLIFTLFKLSDSTNFRMV